MKWIQRLSRVLACMLIIMYVGAAFVFADWVINTGWRFQMNSDSNATYSFGQETNVSNLSGSDTLMINRSGTVFGLNSVGSEPYNITIEGINQSHINFSLQSGLSTISYNISGLPASVTYNFYVNGTKKSTVNTNILGIFTYTTSLIEPDVVHEIVRAPFDFTCTSYFTNGSSCLNNFMIAENVTTINASGDGDCVIECSIFELNFTSQINTTLMDRCNYVIDNGSLYNREDRGCGLVFHDVNVTYSDPVCFVNVTAVDVVNSCEFTFIESTGHGQSNMPALNGYNLSKEIIFYNVTVVDE